MGPFFSHHSTWWRPFLKWCSAKVLKKDIVIANPKKLHSRETPDLEKFLQNQLWRWFLSHLGAIQWTIEHMGKLWFSPNRCRWLHLHPVLKWNIHLSRWKLDRLQNFFPAKKTGATQTTLKRCTESPSSKGTTGYLFNTASSQGLDHQFNCLINKKWGYIDTGLTFWQLIPFWWFHLRLRKFLIWWGKKIVEDWIPSTWFRLYIMTLGLNTHPNGRAWA